MTNDIKKYKFKSNIDLQIEVVALTTLLVSNKKHLFTPHCNLIDEELKLPNDSARQNILKIIYTIFLLADREKYKQGFSEIEKSIGLDYALLFQNLSGRNFMKIKSVSGYSYSPT